MSKTAITIQRINSVEAHPNADRLDVVQVLGYTVVVQKGSFEVGDSGVYFPPDMLIPERVAEDLGVKQYLKHSVFPGDEVKSQCRVSACRLRGTPSYGFLIGPCDEVYGTDVTEVYGGKKYFPPVRVLGGDCLTPVNPFHEYTSIENIRNFPDAFVEGSEVRITGKLHGTSFRCGYIGGQFMAGSHHTRRVSGLPTNLTMYWKPYPVVKNLLQHLYNLHGGDVIIFGEIFGQGIQDMDYGQVVPGFRAFDITIGGRYVDDYYFRFYTGKFDIPTVDSLYCGPFSREVVDEYTDGDETITGDGIRCKFKGREGIVIKPLVEQHSDVLGGRLILKSVSVDYYNRKGAKDLG
jgi:RNA ligase (TIGR02306 family)